MGVKMSTEDDSGPDEGRRRELARLPRELVPPKGLEARVVAALRETDRLAAARWRPNPWRLGGVVAACLALLFAGFWLGRQGGQLDQSPAAPSYVLLMRGATDFDRDGWSEARAIAEMGDWARRRIGVRHIVVSENLDSDGWIVRSSRVGGTSPMDAQDAPNGVFVIVASRDGEGARHRQELSHPEAWRLDRGAPDPPDLRPRTPRAGPMRSSAQVIAFSTQPFPGHEHS